MGWKAGRVAPGSGSGSWNHPGGSEMRLEEPDEAARRDRDPDGTARAARFDKTAAAAASNRPEAFDDVPWTHVPARDPEQSRNALYGRLRRWLRAALGRSDPSADRAKLEPWLPGSSRRRRPDARLLPPEPGPPISGTLPKISPRRSGGLARSQWPTAPDDAGGDPDEAPAPNPPPASDLVAPGARQRPPGRPGTRGGSAPRSAPGWTRRRDDR
jgi:hypothetical protein